MSILSSIIGNKAQKTDGNAESQGIATMRYAFIDTEVGQKDLRVHDIGALRFDGAVYHGASEEELERFLLEGKVEYVCGHNIVHHDAKYIHISQTLVDTLYLSPLLFPERPYHRLVKDDKLMADQMNNPVNDCEKARDLLMDEIAEWHSLAERRRLLYTCLLQGRAEFEGFLKLVGATTKGLHATSGRSFLDTLFGRDNASRTDAPHKDTHAIEELIREEFKGRICQHADTTAIIESSPCALAYALALIGTNDHASITPGWVTHNFPEVEHIINALCHTRCEDGCDYCNKKLDIRHNLKQMFGYDSFRTYNGEPLQEEAVQAAVDGKSLLAIFPTGGGKSLTFQLPALMDGRTVRGLTVVISPLQSLMKDQVDNLADRGFTDAVTINGLLDPISRSLAIERVQSGDATMLYIAPEMLRSKTTERILEARHVVRFVIDEAHCFSSWGQDFRVDYLYIGRFIKEYQERKFGQDAMARNGGRTLIPVSCFTATAKQKVIQDIRDYFNHWLGIEMQMFASSATRTNLRYSVIHADTDDDKYTRLRSLIEEYDCPTIVYVSRTKRTRSLAQKLTRDGMDALPYNGKMDADEKIQNQDAFMSGRTSIIVATSAFGMGVDKSDVGLVVHYDISDSLENYVQEAGRAGRDPHITAHCFVLYCDDDLDKHFILLNQTKLSICEIQQVWRAVRDFTKARPHVNCSALEIARQAGWDDTVTDIETRVRTALSALEQSGYIERGKNIPHVYATGITVRNVDEARRRITESPLFTDDETEKTVRIIKSLISQKYITKAQDYEAESRIDYLADTLGLTKKDVISAVERMRQEGILADTCDMSAYLQDNGGTQRKSRLTLDKFAKLERYILEHIPDESLHISYKQLNDNAVHDGIASSTEKQIRTLLYFLTVKGYAHKKDDTHTLIVARTGDIDSIIKRFERRIEVCKYIIEWLYDEATKMAEKDGAAHNDLTGCATAAHNAQLDTQSDSQPGTLHFSVVELLNQMRSNAASLFSDFASLNIEDVEEALLYLSKIGALKLDGGFLVLYNAMAIHRLKESRLRYKKDDYQKLNEYYQQKIQQIHIVGEYANLMVKSHEAALQFVQDYFQMDYNLFIKKYFKEDRTEEIERNVTPAKYEQLFGKLSPIQKDIIDDKTSRCIVVAAGPGSGKTTVLAHKLASLLLLEDVKHEQLLMLTFSRAAATEFKRRLMLLIGNAAHFVEIKTFHAFCFDLLGRVGNLDDAVDVVTRATKMITDGEVEQNRLRKTVLVIDEAQDMNKAEYDLVAALMEANEDMRVIAVGDDDQNIYEFRGSDSRHLARLAQMPSSRFIEMTENYRSFSHITDASNCFAQGIKTRMKSAPIKPMSREAGEVTVVKHPAPTRDSHTYMYHPVANDVIHLCHTQGTPPQPARTPLQTDKKEDKRHTIGILTQTNQEAAIMLALLHKHGVNAKLMQSMDGLRFCNLAESRYFMKQITAMTQQAKSPIITDAQWNEAKKKTFKKYADSRALHYLRQCLLTFDQTNKTRYYSDLQEFVFESDVEDFCDMTKADVVISTIHKAKGREYDHVFMLVTEPKHPTDEVFRRLYVGMTRAKRTLTIHTNCALFDSIKTDTRQLDNTVYGMPDDIVLQLSHKDINLGFSMPHKADILTLKSGDTLVCRSNRLCIPSSGKDIAMLSAKMQQELSAWESKGYCVSSVTVRFIVAWKPKDAPKGDAEYAIPLTDMVMKKRNACPHA